MLTRHRFQSAIAVKRVNDGWFLLDGLQGEY